VVTASTGASEAPDPDRGPIGSVPDRATSPYDLLPDGVVVADERGLVTVFTAAAARITGIRPAAALGRPLAEALPLTDPAGRDWWLVFNPYAGPATRLRQVERTLTLPDGRDLLVTAELVREQPLGPVRQVVIVVRGTDARARADREQTDLVATVAHELRAPLTGIKGFAATLLAQWDRFSDEQRRLLVAQVDEDANLLRRLIEELLDVARIDAGRLQLRRQPTDVAALVRHRIDARFAAGLDADRVVLDLETDLPRIWVDPDKIGQIVDNLVENAIRHGDGQIVVTLRRDPDGVVISVADEGPGVPDHQSSLIFGRFWKGDGRSRGGSGLGLFIVRGLAEAHGGRVALVPPPEGGARFVVVLPITEAPHAGLSF
jgi:signal transduction histidine kinase